MFKDVNYLTIQGAHDADVSSFLGSSQWDHVRFSGEADCFKSELYVYGANHGQFNTVWGRSDSRGPKSWFLNLRPLLSGAEQRQDCEGLCGGISRSDAAWAQLNTGRCFAIIGKRARGCRDDVLDRYLDSANSVIADFSEDADLTTTTLPGGKMKGHNLSEWHEGKIPFRNGDRGYNGVFLGWNGNAASYPYAAGRRKLDGSGIQCCYVGCRYGGWGR